MASMGIHGFRNPPNSTDKLPDHGQPWSNSIKFRGDVFRKVSLLSQFVWNRVRHFLKQNIVLFLFYLDQLIVRDEQWLWCCQRTWKHSPAPDTMIQCFLIQYFLVQSWCNASWPDKEREATSGILGIGFEKGFNVYTMYNMYICMIYMYNIYLNI